MNRFYRVFGATLESNRAIPGLRESSATSSADIRVELEANADWTRRVAAQPHAAWHTTEFTNERGEPCFVFYKVRDGESYWLRYHDGTEFLLDRDGTRIGGSWTSPSTFNHTVGYLLGPILGIAMRLRGTICLHASAIALEDRAILLMGPAEAGKSTTAAMFARLGYPVLTDDVLALRIDPDQLTVLPGHPRIRLWPDAADHLSAEHPGDLSWAEAGSSTRRHLDLIQNGFPFQETPLPLGAVYVLGERLPEDATPRIDLLRPAQALLTLLANSYANRFLDEAKRAAEFGVLHRLLHEVPVKQIQAAQDAAQLPRLCESIVSDFQSHPRRRTTTPDLVAVGST